VIAHGDAEYVGELHERLQQRCCVVHVARSGEQARLLTRWCRAELVILDGTMPLESGWLTADKLGRENSRVRCIVVVAERTHKDRQFGEFVQAYAVVDRAEGAEAILETLDELEGAELAKR
jgi:DNA-binding response OmpR family regulator